MHDDTVTPWLGKNSRRRPYSLSIFGGTDLSTLLTASFAVVFFLSNGWAVGAQSDSVASPNVKEAAIPIWRTDFRSTVEGPLLGLVVGNGRENLGKPHSSVCFIDKDTIVVSYVTRTTEPVLARRNGPDADLPMQLNTIFVDVASGKIKKKLEFPTDSRYSSVLACHNGMFLTERGTILTLYTSGPSELKRIELPITNDTGWAGHSSPSGRTLLFVPMGLHAEPVPWIWVDTENLRIVRSWRETRTGWIGISDEWIAMTTCTWVHSCEPQVEIKRLDSDWWPLIRLTGKNRPHPKFASEDTLFLLGRPKRLIRVGGETFFEDDTPQGCGWGEALISENGRRIVTPSCKLKGASSTFDLEGTDELTRIRIYDSPFSGLTFDLKITSRKTDFAQLALSPDGGNLVILKGEGLELFQLPRPPE